MAMSAHIQEQSALDLSSPSYASTVRIHESQLSRPVQWGTEPGVLENLLDRDFLASLRIELTLHVTGASGCFTGVSLVLIGSLHAGRRGSSLVHPRPPARTRETASPGVSQSPVLSTGEFPGGGVRISTGGHSRGSRIAKGRISETAGPSRTIGLRASVGVG
ncbi:hypothetical protein VTK73DRAFT_3726 [Phialemonium thermophilum]|uniref:Uncharacterized protein n=1 Tax=Phialemonium thermophilum TaxID=223376 RepID=A0ABR3VFE4_9PEZI